MSHLNKVVQLDTFVDDGLSHSGTVYTGVGTNLHVILDDDDTQLRNLLIAFLIGCKTETVGTNHATGMDGDIVANLASVVNRYVGVDAASVSNLDIVANTGKGADIDILTYLGRL